MASLSLEQALQNISLVIAEFRGTKREHDALQESLNLIKDNIINNKSEV